MQGFSRNITEIICYQNALQLSLYVLVTTSAQLLPHQELPYQLLDRQRNEHNCNINQAPNIFLFIFNSTACCHQTPQLEHQTDRSSGKAASATTNMVLVDEVTIGVWEVRWSSAVAENKHLVFLPQMIQNRNGGLCQRGVSNGLMLSCLECEQRATEHSWYGPWQTSKASALSAIVRTFWSHLNRSRKWTAEWLVESQELYANCGCLSVIFWINSWKLRTVSRRLWFEEACVGSSLQNVQCNCSNLVSMPCSDQVSCLDQGLGNIRRHNSTPEDMIPVFHSVPFSHSTSVLNAGISM